MKGLIGYFLHSYTVSQRFFGPVAGVIIAVLILYSYKPNPVMSSYSATAVFLFIACAWLGLSFLNHEQAVQKQVVIVQAPQCPPLQYRRSTYNGLAYAAAGCNHCYVSRLDRKLP